MNYSGYMQRGGCATCGGGKNNNFRNAYSPSFYNNRYSNYYKNSYNDEEYKSSYSPYNNRQRIMTPPRNYSSYNFKTEDNFSNVNTNNYHNYYSPQRNTGCKNCSVSSNNFFNGNRNQSPQNGYAIRRRNDAYGVNNNNYLNNNNYNLMKSYDIGNRFNDYNREDNRYNSPLRNPPRNLKSSFSSENIFNRQNTNNNYSYNNYSNNNYSQNSSNYNNIRSVLNNKYRNFLDDNINRYSETNSNYFKSGEKRNYYSPSYNNRSTYNDYNNRSTYNDYNNRNNNRNNLYSNSRYNYYRSSEDSKNNYDGDGFISLNVFNYPRKIREMIQQRKTFFVYLYGSRDYTGQSWCSDCNIARPNVEQAKNIIKNKKYEKDLYFVDIPIEKIYMDDFKDDQIIKLERVPTLIFYENGIERGRLIENDLFSYQSISNFINQAYNPYGNNLNRSQFLYRPRSYY
jgi:SWI/SNF-related matrix-associated actin-dependent regulator of chromatin subfamily A protein 2/4